METANTLTVQQRTALLDTLQARFERNERLHPGIAWENVRAKLEADDGKTTTDWTATFTKNVTSAVLSLAQPLTADDTITVAALTLEGSFPADMSLSVEMTNNGLDNVPVWENCTDIQSGKAKAFVRHNFANKTAAKGAAFNYKVTITRGESGVGGNITMIGGVIG